jgi:hypothetical protein
MLQGSDIDGDEYVCTGPQIASVLDALARTPELSRCTWYAAAIDANDPALETYVTDYWKAVANIGDLVERVRATRQLLDGVFIAIEGSNWPERTAEPITAYTPMARLAANSVVELRAFDTTYVEIYSDHPEPIDRLRQRFGGELRVKQIEP